MIPQSFDGRNAAIHPPYDSVINYGNTRYRLIQQRQTQAIWDVSTPGQFLGQIKWFQRSNSFAIVNVNRAIVARPQLFECIEDAVIALASARRSRTVAV